VRLSPAIEADPVIIFHVKVGSALNQRAHMIQRAPAQNRMMDPRALLCVAAAAQQEAERLEIIVVQYASDRVRADDARASVEQQFGTSGIAALDGMIE
jgi:hypothetical protein